MDYNIARCVGSKHGAPTESGEFGDYSLDPSVPCIWAWAGNSWTQAGGSTLAAPFTVSDVNAAHTVDFTFTATPAAGSGANGLTLNRDAAVVPVGLLFSTANAPLWDIGLDATTSDLVLAYDHSKSADELRIRQGGFMAFGDSVGHPGANRLHIISTGATDTGISSLLYLQQGSGSPAGWLIKGQGTAGTEVFSLDGQGRVGIGAPYVQDFTGEVLSVAGSIGISATDADAVYALTRKGTSTQTWILKVNSGDGNKFGIFDNATARAALYITPGFDTNLPIFIQGNSVVSFSKGITHKTKAGTPTDADWSAAPGDGTVVVDTTASKIWARVGGVWKSATLA